MEGRSSSHQYKDDLDELTGLRKREVFVPAIIEKFGDSGETWCCAAIDIHHFKIFNTWFGYEKGNYLLSRIGNYLSELEEKEDAVAAYYGRDNFAVFLRYDRDKLVEIYEVIRGFICSYTNLLGFEFLTEYQNAIVNQEITFYLQPQCSIEDGKIIGVEALARWIQKDGTIVSTGRFVQFLESNGFVTELDKYVWDRVCRWIRSLLDRNITPVPVSVNVSQIDLLSMDVAAYLYSLTEQYHIPTRYLKVEITESAYAENYEAISKTILELKRRGFTVILDDFGTGYSSLNILDKINVDLIKLDILFMKKENSLGKKGIGIVESIFRMTKALELPVIVEGVENEDQIRFLRDLGLKYAQGYYFYEPLNMEQMEVLLKDCTKTDTRGLEVTASDLFLAQEFLKENMFTESTLNRILGAIAYYSLEGDDLTITRFNEPFRMAIGDANMDRRIGHIQNYVVSLDRPALYQALHKADDNTSEGGRCEIRFIKSDGSVFWFRMQFYFLRNDGSRKLYFGKVEDITEQRNQSLNFFDVLRKQSDVTMCIELEQNKIQYVTGENTLYQVDLPSMDLDRSVCQTASYRKRVGQTCIPGIF